MKNPECLLNTPMYLARFAGQVILWATEKAVPMKPIGLPANIQYYQTPEETHND